MTYIFRENEVHKNWWWLFSLFSPSYCRRDNESRMYKGIAEVFNWETLNTVHYNFLFTTLRYCKQTVTTHHGFVSPELTFPVTLWCAIKWYMLSCGISPGWKHSVRISKRDVEEKGQMKVEQVTTQHLLAVRQGTILSQTWELLYVRVWESKFTTG